MSLGLLLDYVQHEARLAQPSNDGSSTRAHLQEAARRGSAFAAKALIGPDLPDALTYLYEWFCDLGLGRGEGMMGRAPLTWESVRAWSIATEIVPAPHEVRALLALDRVWRAPDVATAPVTPTTTETPAVMPKAWPSKKPVVDAAVDAAVAATAEVV